MSDDSLSPFDPTSTGDDDTVQVSLESLREQAAQLETLQKEKEAALRRAAASEREAREASARAKAALETARSYQASSSPDKFISTWITETPHPGILRVTDPSTGSDLLWVCLVLNRSPKIDTFGGRTSYKVAETVIRDCIPYDLVTPSGHLLQLGLRGSLSLKLSSDSQADYEAFQKTGVLPAPRDSDTNDISQTHLFEPSRSTESTKDVGPTAPNVHDLQQSAIARSDSRAYAASLRIRSTLDSLPPSTAATALSYLEHQT